MEFKVGDRVRYIDDGDTGSVTLVDNGWVTVDFTVDGEVSVLPEELELISGNSEEATQTRAEHFKELADLADQPGMSSFEQNVRRILEGVADTVVQKNQAYGDSALNPIRVFSKTDRMEQLYTRLDDKLSRVQKGHEYPGDDTIRDIIGYCTLILIARESQ